MKRLSGAAALASVEVPSAGPQPPAGGRLGSGQRQVVPELPAGADAELGEHLAQVVLRGPGADEQLGADLRVGVALGREPGDLRLLHGEDVDRVYGALAHRLAGRLE